MYAWRRSNQAQIDCSRAHIGAMARRHRTGKRASNQADWRREFLPNSKPSVRRQQFHSTATVGQPGLSDALSPRSTLCCSDLLKRGCPSTHPKRSRNVAAPFGTALLAHLRKTRTTGPRRQTWNFASPSRANRPAPVNGAPDPIRRGTHRRVSERFRLETTFINDSVGRTA